MMYDETFKMLISLSFSAKLNRTMSISRFMIALEREINTPRKVGRPKGSKDKKPRKRPVRS